MAVKHQRYCEDCGRPLEPDWKDNPRDSETWSWKEYECRVCGAFECPDCSSDINEETDTTECLNCYSERKRREGIS